MSHLRKTVGNIRLRDVLGEGGMGTVFSGFDERLRREVAVKALRSDRLDATTRARLLREARLLSQLDHPNICRIYEYVEGDDSDYLVLELIRGKDLRQALDSGVDRRLLLPIAEQVAETLAAAHAKGIVHRDLKPANVMLTSEDSSDPALVKVLDFGIARSLSGESSTDRWSWKTPSTGPTAGLSAYVRTEHGSILGTVTSMSPEQARGEPVTAASDMYSFGLLLQELTTGRPPYEKDLPHHVLLQKATEGDTLPVTGVGSNLAALIERLKALAPEARPTAEETVRRLRWIRNRSKRRQRRLVAATTLIALALGALKYTSDLRRERNLAIDARRAAEQAQATAEQARADAEQVAAFLVDLFKAPDPTQARGEELTARQILEHGAEKVEHELEDQPLVRARLIATIGDTFRNLGLFQESTQLYRRGLAIRRAHLPTNHPDLIDSLLRVAGVEQYLNAHDRAERLYLEALAISELAAPPDPVAVAEILQHLGGLYGAWGDFERAEAHILRALETFEAALDDEDPRISHALDLLALHYKSMGALRLADPIYHRLIARREKEDSPYLAWSLATHAENYLMQGRISRAEAPLRRALEINIRVQGPEHPTVGLFLMLMASVEADQGRFAAAERDLAKALQIHQDVFGPEGQNVGGILVQYGRFYRDTGDSERATQMLERGCRTLEEGRGHDNYSLVSEYEHLAALYLDQGRLKEAEAIYLRMEEIHHKIGNPYPFYLSRVLLGLGQMYLAAGDLNRSDTALVRALVLRKDGEGADDPQLGNHLNALAEVKLARGEDAAAEDLYRRALDTTRRWLEEDPKENLARAALATSHLGLGEVANHRGNAAEARTSWLEAVAILEPLTAIVPKVDYLAPHACALLHLGRPEEARIVAQPLLDAGWQRPRFAALAREHGISNGTNIPNGTNGTKHPEGLKSLARR